MPEIFRATPVPVPVPQGAIENADEQDVDEQDVQDEEELASPEDMGLYQDTEADDSMGDLFTVTNEDVMGEGDENMDDLLTVTSEDVIGRRPAAPVRRAPRFRRTRRPYAPPPSLGGAKL